VATRGAVGHGEPGVAALTAPRGALAARPEYEVAAAAGWAFLALIASIPSFAPWYLVWLLPFAALGRSRPLRVATLLVTLYVMAVHIPAFGGVPWLSQAPGPTAPTRTVAATGWGGSQPAGGSISSTLAAPAFATNTLPVRGSTANVFG
jgi:hypothetical protein